MGAIRNNRGMTLIEVLVAIAIMGIVSMGISSILVNLSRENSAIREKLDALAVQAELLRLLNNDSNCSCLMSALSINTVKEAVNGQITSIPVGYEAGCKPSKDTFLTKGEVIDDSTLTVKSIEVQSLKTGPAGSGLYQGTLSVNLSPKNMVRAIQPIAVPLSFHLDTAGAPTAKKIMGCGAVDNSGSAAGFLSAITKNVHSGTAVVSLPLGKFTEPPVVILQPKWARYTGDEDTTWWVDQVTAKTFRVNWKGPGSSGTSSGEDGVYWMAMKATKP